MMSTMTEYNNNIYASILLCETLIFKSNSGAHICKCMHMVINDDTMWGPLHSSRAVLPLNWAPQVVCNLYSGISMYIYETVSSKITSSGFPGQAKET